MGLETTYRVFRKDALQMLKDKDVQVFETDSNERLAFELYIATRSPFENFEVVDFNQENEPEHDKCQFWKNNW